MNTKKFISLWAFSLLISSCASIRLGDKAVSQSALHDGRLSSEVIPSNYQIKLWVNPGELKFSGQVVIDIDVKSAQSQILIHGQHLEVKTLSLENNNRKVPGTFTLLNKDGLASLNFGETIKPGHYQLSIDYEGLYQDDLSGLYRVKEGKDYYLFTQFEPLSARKMLPCFDEPRFKTPFEITVLSPKGLSVIANSLSNTTYDIDHNTAHVFAKTAPIPTYLLALAVGPFDVVMGQPLGRNHDIPFRGIATKGRGKKMAFAMRETKAIMTALEDYFGIAYPFQKLDILAVPDFASGAMENVGAITFRDWYLMLDDNAAVEQQQTFYEVMAHELAHQWFGNLVTMPWWDDLWLNESFATWLSYKIVDQIRPDFKLNEKLQVRSHNAMEQDSLASVRKIREPIKTTHDIHNAFDSITYSKGGAVLSMLENYLGPHDFQKAVTAHLERFRFGNATSKDFLESLAKTSDNKLVSSAESFLNQSGVPIVELSYTCEKGFFKLNLSQQRFAPAGSEASTKRTWNIPICIGYEEAGSLKKHCFIQNTPVKDVQIKSSTCPAFVMPNYNGQGYYRFSLSNMHWQKLIDAPKSILSEHDRIAIADSLIAELDRNRLNFGLVVKAVRQMTGADSATITKYFMNLMNEAQNYWINKEQRPQLNAYASETLKPIYETLRASATLSPAQKNLKGEIAGFLALKLLDKKTRNELSPMGVKYLKQALNPVKTPVDFDENMVGIALGVALQDQQDEKVLAVVNALAEQQDSVTRKNLLMGIAHARRGEQAELTRNFVFHKNLRKNEQLPLLFGHLRSSYNQPTMWKFLANNLDRFKSHVPKAQLGYLPFLAQGLCTQDSAQEVEALLGPLMSEYQGGPRNLAEAIEAIKICAHKRDFTAQLANSFFVNIGQEVSAR